MNDPLNWTTVLVAFLAAIPATLLATATLLTAMRTKLKVGELHKEVNSRLSELVDKTAEAAQASGELKGAADERNRRRKST